MKKYSKIFIAGHNGMVGSSIMRLLLSRGYNNLILRSSKELDLRNQFEVESFFKNEKPEYVFLAASKVGGIIANLTTPADYIYDNLLIEANVIHAAYKYDVKKLLFLGSSCIYPKHSEQPIKEEYLLGGYLAPENQSYAIAKIAGIQLCNDYRQQHGANFISLMPPNLYGYGDNFTSNVAHVFAALMDRIHQAKIRQEKTVIVWGSGSPLREFLFVDDLADACLFMMENYNQSGHINIGSGQECSIKELAMLISKVVGFEGSIHFDLTKPDGTPRKLLDIQKATKLGWSASVTLEEGIRLTYEWYMTHQAELRKTL
jgi:GDP-L-fucose synthase